MVTHARRPARAAPVRSTQDIAQGGHWLAAVVIAVLVAIVLLVVRLT
jgi:hypothetical protein